ncbi:hypothetical protein [Paracoccus sphaerophysae]|uniref:hypothetical protein n=1 Tax=Paracoccus sphaerophysae TaxID=690417 RepID=UPI00055D5B35|nr:hypothetical protein [Paracoccus sphaerophysae]
MAQIIAWPDGPDPVLRMRAADAAQLAIPGCWRRMSQSCGSLPLVPSSGSCAGTWRRWRRGSI